MINTQDLQVSITMVDPLVKVAARESYRIRVVRIAEGLDAEYAIAATRCEFPRHTEYLSFGHPVPLEAVKRMRTGFALRSDASDRARTVFQALIASGLAQVLPAASAA